MTNDEKFKIDKGITPPPPRHLSRAKWPFDKMEPGDSFYVPPERRKAASSAATNWSKKYGKAKGLKTITRRERDGVRIWVIKAEDDDA